MSEPELIVSDVPKDDLIVVVMRKLEHHDTVVAAVAKVPSSVSDANEYGQRFAAVVKDNICEKFVEFKSARWTYQVVHLPNRDPEQDVAIHQEPND